MKKTRIILSLCICLVASFLLFSCSTLEGAPGETQTPPNVVTVPTQLNFFTKPGTDPPAKELDIGVANRIAAKWSIDPDEAWLSVQPRSGQLPRNFTAALVTNRVLVTVDSSPIPVGTYEAAVSINVEGVEAKQVPVRLYVTNAQPGQNIDAKVDPGQGTAWDAGIKLTGDLEVTVGAADERLFSPWPSPGLEYGVGDLVIIVKGTLTNESDNEWQTDFWPEAFDAEGDEVAWGIDQGHTLPGHLTIDIPAGSSRDFLFHMSWADNVKRIAINANVYDPATPLP